MSMSMSVVGFIPPDDQSKKMKEIWNLCKSAGIEPPTEVCKFFGGEFPGDIEITGKKINLEGICAIPWANENCEGYEVQVNQIPKNVKIIRFYCDF